jgi:hypothetical protein
MTDPTLTPARLWKRMTNEQRLRAARALWAEPEAASDQAQAAGLIATQLKFRAKTVAGLDKEKKARYLTTVPNPPEELAARLLVLYHLAEQRPMMSAFLDAAGIAHDNGLIQEDAAAPDTIAKTYPPQDVALYLNTLLWQDPSAWGVLQGLPEVSLS